MRTQPIENWEWERIQSGWVLNNDEMNSQMRLYNDVIIELRDRIIELEIKIKTQESREEKYGK